MRTIIAPILLIGYYITIVTCQLNYPQEFNSHGLNALVSAGTSQSIGSIDTGADARNSYLSENDVDNNIEKKAERYSMGLGRRAFTYKSPGNGIKRLPVYNFGLGKRSRPYSFGLGKRSNDDEYSDSDISSYDSLQEILSPLHYDDEKRSRPYSFGLGKRELDDEKRSRPYSFGLGKRELAGEKRSRPYSFGLGKRDFGEDALERRSLPQRYSFGLGRR